MEKILSYSFLGNTVQSYLISVSLFMAGIIVIKVLNRNLDKLNNIALKTKNEFDDFIILQAKKKIVPLLYVALVFFSIQNLSLNLVLLKSIRILGVVISVFAAFIFIISIMDHLIKSYILKHADGEAGIRNVKVISVIMKIIVAVIALIIVLDNFNIKISALITGLGIGGVAVAFASQAILTDLFSFFVILLDRPFEIGDFIVFGEQSGVIENIGIKTIRIRSLSGEQIICSNSSLLSQNLHNYKRMDKRRVVFSLGVAYQTSSEDMKKIPPLVKSIIESVDGTIFDRCNFASFADSSLNIETVYYVKGSDYNIYMNIQEKINIKIKEGFEALKIDFAYPTRTLYLHQGLASETDKLYIKN